MRNRPHHVSVYLNDKEFRRFNSIVRKSNLKKSNVLRKMIMDKEIRNAPKSDSKLLAEINTIGVNINQIAKVANTCGYVGDIHIGLLQQEIKNLQEKVGAEIGDY